MGISLLRVEDNITLDETNHRYYLSDDPDFEFVSCTTFIEYFFQKFDRIGIANRLTATNPKYFGMTPQELVKSWEIAANEGTEVHKEIDQYIKHGISPVLPKSELAVSWLNSIDQNRYQIRSETILFAKEIKLAGTVDVIVQDRLTNVIDIYDWKTSKSIDKTSFKNKMGNTPASANIMDCNYITYSLQLSLYRYLLERYYGMRVNKLTLLHLNGGSVIPYDCKYMEDTIVEFLKYDREALVRKTEESLTKEYSF